MAAVDSVEMAAAEPSDESTTRVCVKTMAQKTPISLLQEMCTKKGLTPQYELLSAEGQVHEPTFLFRVTVTDVSATGGGKSKKVAKHMAARSLLERLINLNPTDWSLPGIETTQEAIDFIKNLMPELMGVSGGGGFQVDAGADNGIGEVSAVSGGQNPVGILQEMSSQRKWPPPMYELLSEEGQPHERTFVISVRLGKFVEIGDGRSKKTAKRIAAERMLATLAKIPSEEQSSALVDGVDDDDLDKDHTSAEHASTNGTTDNATTEIDDLSAVTKPENKSTASIQGARSSVLKSLQQMDIEGQSAQLGHVNLLRRISNDESWERVHFQPMPRLSKSGQFQCLVRIGSLPVAVCYGSGYTADAARHAAAKNALEYLKVMTRPG